MRTALPPSPASFFFIRHGETDWNREARLQGRRDIPLNATGRAQAHRNGAALAQHIARHALDPATLSFVASPLGRARETMERMRDTMGLDPTAYDLDPRLIEITFGDWEGSTMAELHRSDPNRVAERKRDKWAFVPPGGESYVMLSVRLGAVVADMSAPAAHVRPAVIVAHGAVMRALRGLIENLPPHEIPILPTPQDRIMHWTGTEITWI